MPETKKLGFESANLQLGLRSVFFKSWSIGVFQAQMWLVMRSFLPLLVLQHIGQNQPHQRSIWCRKASISLQCCSTWFCSWSQGWDHGSQWCVSNGHFSKIPFRLCQLRGGFLHVHAHVSKGVSVSGRCSATNLTHRLSAAPEGTKIICWWVFQYFF